MLLKYIKSVLWRVAKSLSYIEDARCLQVKQRSSLLQINSANCQHDHNNINLIAQDVMIGQAFKNGAAMCATYPWAPCTRLHPTPHHAMANKMYITTGMPRLKSHAMAFRGLTFRHRASSIQGQAFHYSPENAFYLFNQQIYFII